MKLQKKVVALFVLLSMLAMNVMGCGKQEVSESEAQVSAEKEDMATAENEKTEAQEKTHINIFRTSFNIANPDAEEVKKVEAAVNAYIGDKINVEISLSDIGNAEYANKVNLALANQEVNMLWTANWMPTIGTNDLYTQNALYDLTDLVNESGLYNSIPEWVWESAAYDGNTYYVSCYKEGGRY